MPPVQQAAISANYSLRSSDSNGYDDLHLHDPKYNDHEFLPRKHMPLAQLATRIRSRVERFLAQEPKNDQIRSVQMQTKKSLDVIEQALERYDFSELSLSYNGGKDCLVLLILYLTVLATRPSLKRTPSLPLQTVYIVSEHPFVEVEDFVCSTQKTYSLSVTRYAKGMKAGFEEYLHDFPAVKAIFVGTRRTDPHGGNLTHFDETDHGWPQFMRIHPIIDWHYQDIWTFILALKVPYCKLYDKGYTSLGGTTDTNRNPVLRRESMSKDGKPKVEFRPAYELIEDEAERLGREKDWKATAGSVKMFKVEGQDNHAAVFDDDDTDAPAA